MDRKYTKNRLRVDWVRADWLRADWLHADWLGADWSIHRWQNILVMLGGSKVYPTAVDGAVWH